MNRGLRIYLRLLAAATVSVLISCIFHSGPMKNLFIVIAVVLILPITVFWALRFGWQFGGWLMGEAQVAATPIPSPFEIAAGLQAEWGRPPTASEVAVVQQALISRRNQALGAAALGFGALYLSDRH